jgi:hypothetical protein
MSRCSPSSFACLLLESVLPARYREAILADLIEEYAVLTKSSSSFAAWCWFWSQICRSMPVVAWLCLRDGWLVNLCSAITVFVAMAAFKIGIDLTISKLFSPEPMTHVVLLHRFCFCPLAPWLVASLHDSVVALQFFSHWSFCSLSSL